MPTANVQLILEEYRLQFKQYLELSFRLKQLLADLLEVHDVKVHSIEARVKDFESLSGKLQRPDSDYRTLSDVTDVCGLRIITFYEDEVDRVAEIIRTEFQVDETNSIDKRAALDPDRFGYLSLHFVATLPPGRTALTEYRRLGGLKFELQLRSILQHTWAAIEHDLGYKLPDAVPRHIRRQFSRVAGLLELADVEFTTIRKSLAEYQREVESSDLARSEDAPLDKVTLGRFLASDPTSQWIDGEVALHFGVPTAPAPEGFTVLIPRVAGVGIHTLGQLRAALQSRRMNIVAFIREWLQGWGSPSTPTGIGVFYLPYVMLGEAGDRSQIWNYVVEARPGIDPDRWNDEVDKVISIVERINR